MTPLLIGLGQELRGDDAAGLLVARAMRERSGDALRVIEHGGDGMDLVATWEDEDRVFVADAVVSGSTPGTVHRFDAADGPLPARLFATSTHALGIAQAVELARTLGLLPPHLVVWGIEGDRFDTGTGPAPAVQRAIERVTRALLDELGCAQGP